MGWIRSSLVLTGALAVACIPSGLLAQQANVGIVIDNAAARPMTATATMADTTPETIVIAPGASHSFEDVRPIREGERSERRYRVEIRRDATDEDPHCGVDVLVSTAWGAGGSAVGCKAATMFRYCSLKVAGGGTATGPDIGPPPCKVMVTVSDD